MPIPQRTLANGQTLPMVGLGTYLNPEAEEAVLFALQHGYRFIDTARKYENEAGVGAAWRKSGLAREELCLATKVWPSHFGTDRTLYSIEQSLHDLQTDTIDLLYLHWYGEHYRESWRVLERMVDEKVARMIAVSNLTQAQLEELSTYANVAPVVNQLELHPHYQQRELLAYMAKEHIVPVAYSPLARARNGLLEEPVLQKLAKTYGKTPAQIILHWHTRRGIIPIPKSTHPERLLENLDVFDFELQDDELAAIDALERPDGRTGHLGDDAAWLAEIAAQ